MPDRSRVRTNVRGAIGPIPPTGAYQPLFQGQRWPAIPDPEVSLDSLLSTVEALKARAHMQSREKGDYFDSFVTIRDLITLQLLTFTGQQAQDNYVGWDVLFTPTQTVVSAGVTAAPSREAATGMLRFDPSSLEAIFLNIHMPHTWIEGTYLVPYVVWQKTTSATGNVQWKLQHKSLQLDTTMPASWTTVGTVSTVGDGTTDTDTADKTLVSSFGQWDVDGFGMRDGFLLEVSRDAANANDTYAADARLVGFGLRYRTDSYGSAEQLEKVRGYL